MIIDSNPMTQILYDSYREQLSSRFNVLKGCDHNNYLLLIKYLDSSPEKYYSVDAFNDIYSYLNDLKNNDPGILISLMIDNEGDVSRAYQYLNQINRLNIHENKLPHNTYEIIRYYENELHPAFLKLIEGIYSNLIMFISDSMILKNGGYLNGVDVFQRATKLKSTKYEYLTYYYSNTLRNGIAHGKVTYNEYHVTYEDKKGNSEKHIIRHVINEFGEMLDLCNGLSLGICLFYITNREFMETNKIKLPSSIILDELMIETKSPGWEIEDCVNSELIKDRNRLNQLIIYAKSSLLDINEIRYHLYRSAALAEKYAPYYERYHITFRSRYALGGIGFTSFAGTELKKIRLNNSNDISEYKNAIENNFVYFIPKYKIPKLLYKITRRYEILKIVWPLALQKGIKPPEYMVKIRDKSFFRFKLKSTIKCWVYVQVNNGQDLKEVIRKNHKKIINEVIRQVRNSANLTDICRYLPIGYLLIYVYPYDFRTRDYSNGHKSNMSICTIERNRSKGTKGIQLKDPEVLGDIKIFWSNRPSR